MGRRRSRRIEFVLDQTDCHIRISAITQSAPHLSQRTNQLAILPGSRFGKQNAKGFLKSPAPDPRIMNGIRMVADQYLREQGDKLLETLLRYRQKLFVARSGLSRIQLCFAHHRLEVVF
jgi:hypothetical protein